MPRRHRLNRDAPDETAFRPTPKEKCTDRTNAPHQQRLINAHARRHHFAPEWAGMAQLDIDELFACIADDSSLSRKLSRTIAEARRSADARQWEQALSDKLLALKNNKVYDIVPIPHNVRPITSKPVMRIKECDGSYASSPADFYNKRA